MARIDHDAGRKTRRRDRFPGGIHARRIVVGGLPAAQDDVAIGIARGGGDGAAALFGHSQEMMGVGCGLHRIDGDPDVTVGAVLEADGAGQARGELAVYLTFSRAGADGAPRHQVREVLRSDHVEKLAARRQPEAVDVQQQPARQAQALIDAKAAIESRIVDQSLPADGGARFLKIDPHDDLERSLQTLALHRQAFRILLGGVDIVNRAGSDDDSEPVVQAMKDPV